MQTSREIKLARTDIWREGKWLDLWSLVHLISGVSIGFGFYFLQFGTTASALFAFVLLVAYEMWEMIVQIEEAATNRCMDVVVGMVGFMPTFLFIAPSLPEAIRASVFGLTLTLNIILSIVGWHASQKAAALEQRLRVKLITQKARLKERGTWLKERLRKTPKEKK
jgi:hypothetical protein